MFIGNSNISLFFPELVDKFGQTEKTKWLGAVKITDFPDHPAIQYLLKLRKDSNENFFITLGTHDIIQICRSLDNDLKQQLKYYKSLYLEFFQLLNSFGPSHLILFPLPLDTIKINNLSNSERHDIMLEFNKSIYQELIQNKITVIYPQEHLFDSSSLIKSDYLHYDNLHLNSKVRPIYLKMIEQLCGSSYIEKSSLEHFKHSHEIDVFVYLWLSDCNITFQPTIEEKVQAHQQPKITIETFFESLHTQYSTQSHSIQSYLLECDEKIMKLQPAYIKELENTINRVLPQSIPYGIVFFWRGLWNFYQGAIEKAIVQLKKSIIDTRRAAFHDTERVNAYIDSWRKIL